MSNRIHWKKVESYFNFLKGLIAKVKKSVKQKGVNLLVFSLLLIMGLYSCSGKKELNLAGEWQFRLDSLNRGLEEEWFKLRFNESLMLPGTLAGNGIGEDISRNTAWIAKIIDPDLWFDTKYDAFMEDGQYKAPFWLTPSKFYTGVAWYQKEVYIPDSRTGSEFQLELERCHWFSKAWIDTIYLGQQNSLATPHRYRIPGNLAPGNYQLTVRLDNSYRIPLGINAHSVSDNTQGNWNGIVGSMSLVPLEDIFIDDIQVYPDLQRGIARVKLRIINNSGNNFSGRLALKAAGKNAVRSHTVDTVVHDIEIKESSEDLDLILNMGTDYLTWSEWQPAFYELHAELKGERIKSKKVIDFGMREFTTKGTHFEINGKPVFLRGTLECSIFPIEGYPPVEEETWIRIFKKIREYGLNHMRFHSYCPPRAAFTAADKLGIYLQVECGGWATQGLHLGDGEPIDAYIWEESIRIVREYGNHPSFCMMAYGNEADGAGAVKYLEDFVKFWKNEDERRVYTSSAGWPITNENQFFSTLQGRLQEWNERGSTYFMEDNPPTTEVDYENIISNYPGPFVSHEIGQWCAYPDYSEISDYTGVYKAGNLELFRAELEQKGMLHQAEDFLFASGKLQALCYKNEIEAALKTKGLGGFQLLDLHDFPGQGTALVGVLTSNWNEKGYITAEEYRQFCDTTVLLASIPSLVLTSNDTLIAGIEMYHYGQYPLDPGKISWEILDEDQILINQGSIDFYSPLQGAGNPIGRIDYQVINTKSPAKYSLHLSLEGTQISNSYDFFVFPAELPSSVNTSQLYRCRIMDEKAKEILDAGGTVWLDLYDNLKEEFRAKSGFVPVYWNTLTFNSQPIHTLGLLCDPEHPVFNEFPATSYSNWQWWDILTDSKAMILDSLRNTMPLLQMIDSYHSNRKLGLMVEGKWGNGKLLISTINFDHSPDDRPAARQLRFSIEKYLQSDAFDPSDYLTDNQVEMMINE